MSVTERTYHAVAAEDPERRLPAYRRRGDREIWRLHPYERTAGTTRRCIRVARSRLFRCPV
jgi:hypothetical protein